MKERRSIRVLVVDDHPVVHGDAAIQAARDHSPDVVLLDIDLPGRNGLSVAEILRNELPDIKVVILSMFTSEGYVMQALKSGVQGCLPKGSSMDEVARAVQCVSDGDVYFSEGVARMALGRMVRNGQATPSPEDLTQREREVLVQIAEGLSNKEIASALNLGVRTVETHRDRLMRKLGIHSVAGLTKFAIRHGLSTLGNAVSA